jgi:hypothetical protein
MLICPKRRSYSEVTMAGINNEGSLTLNGWQAVFFSGYKKALPAGRAIFSLGSLYDFKSN